MPLTPAESEFLAVYVYEYMRNELGPASRKLKGRGLVYSDLIYLMDAYIRENGLEISKVPDQHSNVVEVEGFGRYNPNPPDPPWPDQETAQRRNAEMLAERNTLDGGFQEANPPPRTPKKGQQTDPGEAVSKDNIVPDGP